MGINLQKGQKTQLAESNLTIGLGWSVNTGNGQEFDLDCSVFMLNDQKLIPTDKHFIFYGNTESPDGSVKHSGDNRKGDKDGDDETITINTSKIDESIKELLFVVTIHDAVQRGQNYGQVRDSYIRIIDNSNGTEIAKFDLNEDFSIEKSVEFGRIYQKDGQWKFDASGIGYNEELDYFVAKYYQGSVKK